MTPEPLSPLPTADIAAAADRLKAMAHQQTPARIGAVGSWLMERLANRLEDAR